MASKIALKRRITSVKNTRQITKAMELVAASKMKKAQEFARHGRAYRSAAHSLLSRINQMTEVEEHPLFKKREIKRRLYIVLSSNRGLAGAYNANVMRLLSRSIINDTKNDIKSSVIAVGKQAAQFTRRLQEVELVAAYPMFGDQPTANDIRPILNTIVEQYSQEMTDNVVLIYTDLKSNILQVATSISLLPAQFDEEAGDSDQSLMSVTFEPSVQVVLDNVAERLLEIQIWQAMLESIASEHSMRMMAMKSATDNASDLIDDLTLAFNTARQAAITQELAEITGGAEAIK
ncbi:ATP synthase F1 subunit gamma [Candidatus Saccharibacteria bacterium]|nr:ATP synthase F1 subunit gamma [Candidatus Saccharibacteria bacterium]